jgi:hypothetical protein
VVELAAAVAVKNAEPLAKQMVQQVLVAALAEILMKAQVQVEVVLLLLDIQY